MPSERISFHSNVGHDLSLDLTGKGLGFFGSQGSGDPIQRDTWQGSTYVVENDVPYAQVNNIIYYNAGSGLVDGELLLPLTSIPNYQSTINIRFERNTPTHVMYAKCNLYDGVNIETAPYGIQARVAEVIHTTKAQIGGGSGDAYWHVASTGEFIDLANNPGPNGEYVDRYSFSGYYSHDWYLAISVSPEQVGSKHAGLYVYLEYL